MAHQEQRETFLQQLQPSQEMLTQLINSGQLIFNPVVQQQQATEIEQQQATKTELGGDQQRFADEMSDFENENETVEFDKEIFIESVRGLRSLWDVNDKSYKDRTVRTNAWKKLSSMFGKDVEFLQRQLKNLKDSLKKCLDKRKRMTRSGAAASTLPKCKFYDLMAFLHEKSANKATESNLSLNDSSTISHQVGDFTGLSPLNSPTSSSSVDTNSSGIPCKTPVAKRRKNNPVETALEKSLADCDSALKTIADEEKDEDALFCRSLVPILKDLPVKKRRLAKIKISQLLFDLQYGDEE